MERQHERQSKGISESWLLSSVVGPGKPSALCLRDLSHHFPGTGIAELTPLLPLSLPFSRHTQGGDTVAISEADS